MFCLSNYHLKNPLSSFFFSSLPYFSSRFAPKADNINEIRQLIVKKSQFPFDGSLDMWAKFLIWKKTGQPFGSRCSLKRQHI